jgi:hypothetical protein
VPVSADWRQRAERERQEKTQRLRRDAQRRLRRIARAATARFAVEGPSAVPREIVFDSERFAAPLSERLGPRDRIQILLWGSLLIVGAFALVSFFSAPLMDLDIAVSAVAVAAMLVVSYVI